LVKTQDNKNALYLPLHAVKRDHLSGGNHHTSNFARALQSLNALAIVQNSSVRAVTALNARAGAAFIFCFRPAFACTRRAAFIVLFTSFALQTWVKAAMGARNKFCSIVHESVKVQQTLTKPAPPHMYSAFKKSNIVVLYNDILQNC